jgi:hypothetical protein
MQIGNNRPNGPQPHDRKNGKLDPDLTRANREGIEKASNQGRETTQRAIEERSPARNAESLKSRDTFERSRPQDDAGPSVEERIKNARQGAKNGRIENARGQRAERIESGRVQNTEARQATRIAGAREQSAKSAEGGRVENARTPAANAERIENARTQRAEAQATRVENARVQDTEARAADRVSNARDQSAKALQADRPDRVENARTQRAEAQATRVENARDQHARVENAAGTQESGVSRESVAVSDSAASLASSELPGLGGSHESNDARAERIAELRKAFQAGELNSPERLRNAAARLLAGE